MQAQVSNKKNAAGSRSPIVVVMGHIDHGKSSLLDYIRKTGVVAKEAGGITQHIGAYEAEVKCENPSAHRHGIERVTFLDTPGHEAFSQMRTRGAKVADIAVLVIAADDGVKPQTMEAYEAIKTAKIPFVIAFNKIDKPGANVDMVKQQLAEKGIYVEGYGGDATVMNVSAKTGDGVNELLDMLLLMAEMEGLSGNADNFASGVVIESHLDRKRGITATLLIMDGTMKKGMFVAAGESVAPVRIFENFLGKVLEEASFSSPVRITGFDKMPGVGTPFAAFGSKAEAEKSAQGFHFSASAKKGVATVVRGNGKEERTVLHLLIKTDVSGSLEALEKEIKKMEDDKVFLDIVYGGVGNVTENDVKIISGKEGSIVLGFNVPVDDSAKTLAERFGVEIFTADIIYRISEWLAEKIEFRKKKEAKDAVIGSAKILKTFNRAKNKQVVGGRALSGKVADGSNIVIKRRDVEIGAGRIVELQHNKVKAKEVVEGDEFGMMVEAKIELVAGDTIEIMGKIL